MRVVVTLFVESGVANCGMIYSRVHSAVSPTTLSPNGNEFCMKPVLNRFVRLEARKAYIVYLPITLLWTEDFRGNAIGKFSFECGAFTPSVFLPILKPYLPTTPPDLLRAVST
jgi:hypothetical protein